MTRRLFGQMVASLVVVGAPTARYRMRYIGPVGSMPHYWGPLPMPPPPPVRVVPYTIVWGWW